MSGVYGHSDRGEAIGTLAEALDAGVALLDTGDFYGMGHNELLLAEALRGRPREEYLLSVKYGAMRGPDGSWVGYDASPVATKNALAHSLTRLGVDHVDVYRPARLDPRVPIEETVGAIAELVQAGYVRHIGLSEVGAETLRRAAAVHPICDVQLEYALVTRGIERAVLPACRELGVSVTAYGVLSRGLIGGHYAGDPPPGDWRAHAPRFAPEHLEHNLRVVDELRALADARGASVAQIAFAWVLAKGDDIVPLVGAKTRERLTEALGALEVTLSEEEIAALEGAVPPDSVLGDRYPAPQMATLDSERE
jgi:aryl-alcohol dehydrogenase-like predicted oxidoreductase